MGRWNNSSAKRPSGKPVSKSSKKVESPLHAIKRGLASLFVCAIVILPIILTINQWSGIFGFKFHIGVPNISHMVGQTKPENAGNTGEAGKAGKD
jgi:hypothetical protein